MFGARANRQIAAALTAAGLGALVQRVRRFTRWLRERDRAGPLPMAAGRTAPRGPLALAPCDLRGQAHVPNRVARNYGLDTGGTVEYRFNSAGYRSEEIDPQAALRILVIGESHALGVGVPFEACFAQRFKHHLAAAWRMDARAINLINLSVGGASADYCARALLRQIDGVAPDLVLVVLPRPDRMEDYADGQIVNYNVSGIDLDRIDEAPIPLQGFIDLYNPQLGLMNLAKNALLIQMACRLRGIEHLVVSEDLTPAACATPVLQPVHAQLDTGRILNNDYFRVRADIGADHGHAGPRTHEAVAIRTLARYAALVKAGDPARGKQLAAHVAHLKATSGDWAFVEAAREP